MHKRVGIEIAASQIAVKSECSHFMLNIENILFCQWKKFKLDKILHWVCPVDIHSFRPTSKVWAR